MKRALFFSAFAFAPVVVATACGPGPQPRVPPAATGSASASDVPPMPPGGDVEGAFRAGLLQRESAVAIAEGAEPLSVLGVEAGGEGDRIGAFVTRPKDGCLLLLGRGTRTIDDLDLVVFGDDGAIVASDEGPDPRPSLVLCGSEEKRLFASARVTQGRGLFALGVQRLSPRVAFKVGKALGARNGGIPGAPAPEAWAGLDAKAAAFRASLPGTWTELKRQAVPVDAGARGRVTYPIEAGACIAALITPTDETPELDVEIEDAEGRVLGRAEPRAPRDQAAVVCSASAGEATFALRPRLGEGLAAVVVLRGNDAVDGPRKQAALEVFPRGSLDEATAALGRRRTGEGYAAPTARAKGELKVGVRTDVELTVPAGCSRVEAVAGSPVAGVLMEVWSPDGALLARADGAGAASAHVCLREARKVRVELEAGTRGGPFAIEVRSEASPADLLSPAGARALTRLAWTARPAPLSLAKTFDVQADREDAHTVSVAKGACVDVAAGAEVSSAPVELRASDTGGEVARARGVGGASLRVCVKEATSLTIRTRTDGRAKAVALAVR